MKIIMVSLIVLLMDSTGWTYEFDTPVMQNRSVTDFVNIKSEEASRIAASTRELIKDVKEKLQTSSLGRSTLFFIEKEIGRVEYLTDSLGFGSRKHEKGRNHVYVEWMKHAHEEEEDENYLLLLKTANVILRFAEETARLIKTSMDDGSLVNSDPRQMFFDAEYTTRISELIANFITQFDVFTQYVDVYTEFMLNTAVASVKARLRAPRNLEYWRRFLKFRKATKVPAYCDDFVDIVLSNLFRDDRFRLFSIGVNVLKGLDHLRFILDDHGNKDISVRVFQLVPSTTDSQTTQYMDIISEGVERTIRGAFHGGYTNKMGMRAFLKVFKQNLNERYLQMRQEQENGRAKFDEFLDFEALLRTTLKDLAL